MFAFFCLFVCLLLFIELDSMRFISLLFDRRPKKNDGRRCKGPVLCMQSSMMIKIVDLIALHNAWRLFETDFTLCAIFILVCKINTLNWILYAQHFNGFLDRTMASIVQENFYFIFFLFCAFCSSVLDDGGNTSSWDNLDNQVMMCDCGLYRFRIPFLPHIDAKSKRAFE